MEKDKKKNLTTNLWHASLHMSAIMIEVNVKEIHVKRSTELGDAR